MRSLALWLLLLASCERSQRDATPAGSANGTRPQAVWWRESLRDSRLFEGGVSTAPPGREDALVPALYQAARGWAARCAARPEQLPAPEVRIEFDLRLNPDGTIVRARPRSVLLLGVCVAEAMEQSAPLSPRFATHTDMVVQLAFVRDLAAPRPQR
jgi:hypothetical protein